MADLALDPEPTDAGAMERLLLLETADPDQRIYDRGASLKAMRWMKQVIDNRLAAPVKSRFGEPRNARSETDIIAVGNQFAGFGDYPDLDPALKAKLHRFLHLGGGADRRSAKYAAFVADAITAATEQAPPADARLPDLAAWRTSGRDAPGGDFRYVASPQGDDFYAASPVPPHPPRRAR